MPTATATAASIECGNAGDVAFKASAATTGIAEITTVNSAAAHCKSAATASCKTIAIALANRPKLLLADEPTGSVDQRTSDALLDVFRRLNQELGITIVIVTHDINLAKKVKRVVMMRDGKTSSERIIKQEFADPSLLKGFVEEETHDEFAILDRAGRVQIPREMLDAIGVKGNRIRLQLEDGRILVTNGESEDGEDGDDGKDGKSGKEGKSRRKNKG